jgi:Putative heavy-metal-binding
MRISSTDVIEGGRVLYAIGKIKAATAWHAADGAPLQDNWRELALSELIRRAEDIDADAIIGLDYETDGIVPVEETGVQLKRILATGIAVKLSCAAQRGLRKVADLSEQTFRIRSGPHYSQIRPDRPRWQISP